ERIGHRVHLATRHKEDWAAVVPNDYRGPRTHPKLWIESVDGRDPVVVVRTCHTMHEAHATIDTPLTMTDSATSGSATPELAIIGIPAAQAQGRRINIGVVNVGDFPATFRISARTRSGMAIGQSIESGVEED